MIYVDSSCLVAMVTVEPRTADVIAWLAANQNVDLCSGDWCATEVASALALKVRTGQLNTTLADAAWQAFEQACDGLLRLVGITSADFVQAAQLCRIYPSGLRAGDALHLAVAQRWQCQAMWSLDENLDLNARAHGLDVAWH